MAIFTVRFLSVRRGGKPTASNPQCIDENVSVRPKAHSCLVPVRLDFLRPAAPILGGPDSVRQVGCAELERRPYVGAPGPQNAGTPGEVLLR